MSSNVFEEELRTSIRQLLRKDQLREDIFVQLIRDMNLNEFSVDSNKKLFECFEHETQISVPGFGEIHKLLLKLILIEAEKLQHELSNWTNMSCFNFYNSRYGFEFDLSNQALYLLDNWHNEKRQFKLAGDLCNACDIANCHIECINSNHLFVVKEARMLTQIYLVRLDFEKAECTFLSSECVRGSYYGLIFDDNDRHRFVLCTHEHCFSFQMPGVSVYLSKLKDSTIIVNKGHPFLISFRARCLRLNRHIIGCIYFNCLDLQINSKSTYLFGIYPLLPNQQHPAFEPLLEVNSFLRSPDAVGFLYYWFENKCYIALIDGCITTGIAVLDLYGRKITKLDYLKHNDERINKIHVDESGILSVATCNKFGRAFSVYRFALKEPDNLLYQSLFKALRVSKENNRDFKGNSPAHLKPLAICNTAFKDQEASTSNVEMLDISN